MQYTNWRPTVSYTHLGAHETKANLVCRLLFDKKKYIERVRINKCAHSYTRFLTDANTSTTRTSNNPCQHIVCTRLI